MLDDAATAQRPEAEARLEPRLDTLEIRLTEQQMMLDDLNKVVLDQWREITELKLMVERLEAQLADAAMEGGVAPQDEPPPPHY
jgi:SlyX protein